MFGVVVIIPLFFYDPLLIDERHLPIFPSMLLYSGTKLLRWCIRLVIARSSAILYIIRVLALYVFVEVVFTLHKFITKCTYWTANLVLRSVSAVRPVRAIDWLLWRTRVTARDALSSLIQK